MVRDVELLQIDRSVALSIQVLDVEQDAHGLAEQVRGQVDPEVLVAGRIVNEVLRVASNIRRVVVDERGDWMSPERALDVGPVVSVEHAKKARRILKRPSQAE